MIAGAGKAQEIRSIARQLTSKYGMECIIFAIAWTVRNSRAANAD
jgi:hypothetical protein